MHLNFSTASCPSQPPGQTPAAARKPLRSAARLQGRGAVQSSGFTSPACDGSPGGGTNFVVFRT